MVLMLLLVFRQLLDVTRFIVSMETMKVKTSASVRGPNIFVFSHPADMEKHQHSLGDM